MSFLRNAMKMANDDPAPVGSFKFTCIRMVDKYTLPVQVEYVDTFSQLEIAVEEIANEGVLMNCEVCTVSMEELTGYGVSPETHKIRWGNIGHILQGITFGDYRIYG